MFAKVLQVIGPGLHHDFSNGQVFGEVVGGFDAVSREGQPISWKRVENMLRNPWPVISSLEYPRRLKAARMVLSLMGLELVRILGNK